jgi:hypothetical protein
VKFVYNRNMDRKSKILLYIFFFLFVGTVMFSFARYIIFRDFEVVRSEEAPSEEPVMDDAMIPGADQEPLQDIETPEEIPSL